MPHRLIWFLAGGHLFTDVNQGALPALLPFFIAEYRLSYAAAAGLVAALGVASTVVQPLFGFYADRISKPWLMQAGLVLAGCGLAVTGFIEDYPSILLAVVISGIGIAAYHPEAARWVHQAAGERKATAMSVFGVGGQMGFALGPAMVVGAVAVAGLKGTLILSIPVLLMAFFLGREMGAFREDQEILRGSRPRSADPMMRDAWVPFSFLTAVGICRSIIFYGLNTFIPLYWIDVLKQSKGAGAGALSILFAAGVVGNLVGGRLADRYGSKNLIVIGYVALLPLLWVFLGLQSVTLATLLLFPMGFVLLSTYSPIVVLGQRYLPNHVGLASGITLGVAVSVGGIVAPVFGKIADHSGIPAALMGILVFSFLAILLSIPLRQPEATASPPHRIERKE